VGSCLKNGIKTKELPRKCKARGSVPSLKNKKIKIKKKNKIKKIVGCWWLTPVILATQEAEIRRIVVQSQS
jgi:hypothetical protein